MSLGYTAAAAISGAGAAGNVALLQQQKDQAELDKATLVTQMQGDQAVRLAGVNADYAAKAAALAPTYAGQAAGLSADAVTASTLKNADALRGVKTADATAAAQAALDFSTDPGNVQKKAAADAAAAKYAQTSNMALQSQLANTPGALDNMRRIAMAEHPEAAAQMALAGAQTLAAQFALTQAKTLDTAKQALAATDINDPTYAAKRNVVQGLEYSVANDRTEQAANAALSTSLHGQMQIQTSIIENAMTTEDAKSVARQQLANLTASANALTQRNLSLQGIKPDAVAKTGWDNATGEVWNNGVKIGTAKNAADASAMIHNPASPTTSTTPPPPASAPAASVKPAGMPTGILNSDPYIDRNMMLAKLATKFPPVLPRGESQLQDDPAVAAIKQITDPRAFQAQYKALMGNSK